MTLSLALVLAAAAPAAGAANTAVGGGGGLTDILTGPFPLMIVMGVAFYFLLLRPQQQRAKQHQNMVTALKRGDTVVLSSGIIGKVVRVEDKEIGVEIAQNVTIKVVKSMVQEVRARGEPAAANDVKL